MLIPPLALAVGALGLLARGHADWGKTGIVPDVEVSAEWNTFAFDTDPAVAVALNLFGHQ